MLHDPCTVPPALPGPTPNTEGKISETRQDMDLMTLCESLKANAASIATKILENWDTIAEGEPWQALPPDLDHDHLPDLIRSLASAGLCTEFDRDLCRVMVTDSATHGDHRAAEGMDDALLYREYHLLRRALAKQLQRDHGENAAVFYATMRMDALIGLASSAALHGMNRAALEQEGRWPHVLDELLDGWPLPRP